MKYNEAMEYAKRVAARPVVAEGDPDEACIIALYEQSLKDTRGGALQAMMYVAELDAEKAAEELKLKEAYQ